MKVIVLIEDDENGQAVQMEKECTYLSDIASIYTDVTTAAFGYEVKATLKTDTANFGREGYVG